MQHIPYIVSNLVLLCVTVWYYRYVVRSNRTYNKKIRDIEKELIKLEGVIHQVEANRLKHAMIVKETMVKQNSKIKQLNMKVFHSTPSTKRSKDLAGQSQERTASTTTNKTVSNLPTD